MKNTIYLDQTERTTIWQRIFISAYIITNVLLLILLGIIVVISVGAGDFDDEAVIGIGGIIGAGLFLQVVRIAYIYILFSEIVFHPYKWPIVDEAELFAEALRKATTEDNE